MSPPKQLHVAKWVAQQALGVWTLGRGLPLDALTPPLSKRTSIRYVLEALLAISGTLSPPSPLRPEETSQRRPWSIGYTPARARDSYEPTVDYMYIFPPSAAQTTPIPSCFCVPPQSIIYTLWLGPSRRRLLFLFTPQT